MSARGAGLGLAAIGVAPGTAPAADARGFAGSSLVYSWNGTACAHGVNATIRSGSTDPNIYVAESWCRHGKQPPGAGGRTWAGYVGWAIAEPSRRAPGTRDAVVEAAPTSAHSHHGKMSDDGHVPPKGVQEVGQRAVRWIEDGKAGRNFTDTGRHRARQLADGKALSDEQVKKMQAYFKRHSVDKKADGFKHGTEGFPSPGRVAWDAWGGDEGERWVGTIDL